MSSVTGNKIKLCVFGESHGQAIGCVIDSLPAGLKLDLDKIRLDMQRRAPGRNKQSTARKEADEFEIVSGLLNGETTGAPLTMYIKNTNTRSTDYENIKLIARPSHSDYPAFIKYSGKNDSAGGGHFSGRLTAPIVFAGAVAKQALAERGVFVGAHIAEIAGAADERFDKNNIDRALLARLGQSEFSLIDENSGAKMRELIEQARLAGDSVGGEIECAVIGMPVGAGANIFDTVESRLSAALFAVPAVKGVQFGAGFGFSAMRGSEANDCYGVENGRVVTLSNNNGGILGGMTTGAPVVFSVAIKPTPSISVPQQSVNLKTMQNETLVIKGRHDPCIVQRAVPVIEAMAAFTMLDILI
ncbi:MAG: chorismate synthase [Clostridiales bacterium]|nr:chorismate synthase [Clostridiales bacterium]